MTRIAPILAVLIAAAPAGATSGFPTVIKGALELAAAPPCTVCHLTTAGGANTATRPFAVSVRAAGLVPFNDASLEAALAQLSTDGTDSDDDGTGDIDELVLGTDPNAAGEGEGEGEGEGGVEPLQYGFGCAGTPAMPALTIAALALLFRRWRSRSARPVPEHIT